MADSASPSLDIEIPGQIFPLNQQHWRVDFTRFEHSKNLLHLFNSVKAIDDQGIEWRAAAHLTEKPIEHFMGVTHNCHLTTPQSQQKNRFPTGIATPVEHQNPGVAQTSSPFSMCRHIPPPNLFLIEQEAFHLGENGFYVFFSEP
jgi:hypothetical protein